MQLLKSQWRLISRRLYSSYTADTLNITRKAFAKVSDVDLDLFRAITNVFTDRDSLEPYNKEWLHQYQGQSQVLLKPTSTEQVSQILKHCYDRNLAVVPVGGRTGLVGGATSVFDEILISLENLNQVRSFDEVSGAFVADAGLVLQAADEYLNDRGHMFPLDLGAKGSCQIGGNISTNAGGVRLLRYGSLHGSVLGIEAVLSNGSIFNGLSTMRKDNSGYDLKHLFIGTEGTLGIVTGISVICPALPKSVNVAFLSLNSYEKVQNTYLLAKRHLAEILGSFECMDKKSLDLVDVHYDFNKPVAEFAPYSVLIETRGADNSHDQEKLHAFFEELMDQEIITDGIVAQSSLEQREIWKWREEIPNAASSEFGFVSYDISLPLPVMFDIVEETENHIQESKLIGETEEYPVIAVTGFGHIGDGNLHLILAVRRYDPAVISAMEPFIFECVSRHNGSIASEHGIGIQKRSKKKYSRGPEQLAMMRMIKEQLDPKGILNPYKYFDGKELHFEQIVPKII